MHQDVNYDAEGCAGGVKEDVGDFTATTGDESLMIFVGGGVNSAEQNSEPRGFLAEFECASSEKTKNCIFEKMSGFSDDVDEKIDIFKAWKSGCESIDD